MVTESNSLLFRLAEWFVASCVPNVTAAIAVLHGARERHFSERYWATHYEMIAWAYNAIREMQRAGGLAKPWHVVFTSESTCTGFFIGSGTLSLNDMADLGEDGFPWVEEKVVVADTVSTFPHRFCSVAVDPNGTVWIDMLVTAPCRLERVSFDWSPASEFSVRRVLAGPYELTAAPCLADVFRHVKLDATLRVDHVLRFELQNVGEVRAVARGTLFGTTAQAPDRRAPVQACSSICPCISHRFCPGTISWEEHLRAWEIYETRWGSKPSAEQIAERSGFSYGELMLLFGREPETWLPVRTLP